MMLQAFVKIDFLGRHGFRFDDQVRVPFLGERENEVGNLFGVFAKDYLAAMRFHLASEFFQVMIQMLNGMALDGVSVCAQFLVVGAKVRLNRFATLFYQSASGLVDGKLELWISQRSVNFLVEGSGHI